MTSNINQTISNVSVLDSDDSESYNFKTYVFFAIKTANTTVNDPYKIVEVSFVAVARENIMICDSFGSLDLERLTFLVNPEHIDISGSMRKDTYLTMEILQKEPNFKASFARIFTYLENLPTPVCLITENELNLKILLTECVDANVSLPTDLKGVSWNLVQERIYNNTPKYKNEYLLMRDNLMRFYKDNLRKTQREIETAEKKCFVLLEVVFAVKKHFFPCSDKIAQPLTAVKAYSLEMPSVSKNGPKPLPNVTKHLTSPKQNKQASRKRSVVSTDGLDDHRHLEQKGTVTNKLQKTHNGDVAANMNHDLDLTEHQTSLTSFKSLNNTEQRIKEVNGCLLDIEIYRKDGLEVDKTLQKRIRKHLHRQIFKALQDKTNSKCLNFDFARLYPEGHFLVRPARKESRDWLLSLDFSTLGEPMLLVKKKSLVLIEISNLEEEFGAEPVFEDPLLVLKAQNTERDDLKISQWLLISKKTTAPSLNSPRKTIFLFKVPLQAAAVWDISSVETLYFFSSVVQATLLQGHDLECLSSFT